MPWSWPPWRSAAAWRSFPAPSTLPRDAGRTTCGCRSRPSPRRWRKESGASPPPGRSTRRSGAPRAARSTCWSETMNAITIRLAVPKDEHALGRYGGALMRQHHALDPLRFVQSDNPEAGYGRFLASEIKDPDAVVVVAEAAGEVIGYAFASLEPMSWKDLRDACGFLHDVYVDSRWRRGGAGER